MPITVTGERTNISEKNEYVSFYDIYTDMTGLKREQHREVSGESDWNRTHDVRYSNDNGRSWSEWTDIFGDDYTRAADGSWERMKWWTRARHLNPVHNHMIGLGMEVVFINGHNDAYAAYWKGKKLSTAWHAVLTVRKAGEDTDSEQPVHYEPGPEYDPNNPTNPEYFITNGCSAGSPFVMKNGDILLTLHPPTEYCCRRLGIDMKTITPDDSVFTQGMMVARGKWDGSKYAFTFSEPVVINDMQSSRGFWEATVAELNSGRIVVVMRGSNWLAPGSRMEPGTPPYKWYTYSDDGGKTFVPAVPWHYDTGEAIYASATPSYFIRSTKNGKLYWTGNITDHTADGNYPRFPIVIVQVDDTYGYAIRDMLTVIDTQRDYESDKVQLTNHRMLEDRETKNIELYLEKLGASGIGEGVVWKGDSWKYIIDVGL